MQCQKICDSDEQRITFYILKSRICGKSTIEIFKTLELTPWALHEINFNLKFPKFLIQGTNCINIPDLFYFHL